MRGNLKRKLKEWLKNTTKTLQKTSMTAEAHSKASKQHQLCDENVTTRRHYPVKTLQDLHHSETAPQPSRPHRPPA
jgi:hypothetical protein